MEAGIVGINFAWRITDWNKSKLDKQLLQLQAQQVEYAEETFDFNLQTAEESYLTEVDRIRDLIITDEAISDLQAEILLQMSAQLDEGVITSSDYLIQANAELQARQSMAIHQIELLKLQLEFWNSRGSL